VIRPALSAFLDHPRIAAVQPVIHREDEAMFVPRPRVSRSCCRRYGAARRARHRCVRGWKG
jgi:hypothetical protein